MSDPVTRAADDAPAARPRAAAARRPAGHGLGVTSSVASVLALLTCVFPWYGIALGAAGIVCGHVAAAKVGLAPAGRDARRAWQRDGRRTAWRLAIAGLLIGYPVVAANAVWTWWVAGMTAAVYPA